MKLLDTDIFIDFLCGKSEAVTLFNENVDEIIFSAITKDAILITRNLKDFKKIKNLKFKKPY